MGPLALVVFFLVGQLSPKKNPLLDRKVEVCSRNTVMARSPPLHSGIFFQLEAFPVVNGIGFEE